MNTVYHITSRRREIFVSVWVFPGGKDRPRRDADPSPPSSSMVKKA